jgi:hypothetical protein
MAVRRVKFPLAHGFEISPLTVGLVARILKGSDRDVLNGLRRHSAEFESGISRDVAPQRVLKAYL